MPLDTFAVGAVKFAASMASRSMGCCMEKLLLLHKDQNSSPQLEPCPNSLQKGPRNFQ